MLDKLERITTACVTSRSSSMSLGLGSSFVYCGPDDLRGVPGSSILLYMTDKTLCLGSDPEYLQQEIRPFASAVAMLR